MENREQLNKILEFSCKVVEAADIVEIIGERVKLTPKGKNFIGICPFHKVRRRLFGWKYDERPTMYVSPEKQIYKCFRCGQTGSVVNFLMEYEGWDYTTTIWYLAKRYGVNED